MLRGTVGGAHGRERMTRFSLNLSLAVILLYWVFSIGSHLMGFRNTAPAHVSAIAMFVCMKTIVAAGIIWLLLRANGERLTGLGFGMRLLRLALLRGLIFAGTLFLIINVILTSALAFFNGKGTSPALIALFRDPREAPLWIFSAILGGGFTEELMRAFVLTRFCQRFGRGGLMLALVIDSVVFGMDHLYQGTTGGIKAGVTGLLLGLIFLHRRRVADAMVAHALYDLIGVATAYVLYAQRL